MDEQTDVRAMKEGTNQLMNEGKNKRTNEQTKKKQTKTQMNEWTKRWTDTQMAKLTHVKLQDLFNETGRSNSIDNQHFGSGEHSKFSDEVEIVFINRTDPNNPNKQESYWGFILRTDGLCINDNYFLGIFFLSTNVLQYFTI